MSKPDFIPESDWNLVLRYANNFENEPYLIAGIGWHETHWGRLGAGKIGFILGYGYWPGSTVKDKYKGLTNQLKGANNMLVDHLNLPITLNNVTDFAVNHWKSSAPRSWASSVYSIFSNIAKGIIPQFTETERQDLTEVIEKVNFIYEFFEAIMIKLKERFGNER
jgi:hypothetical protein